MSRTRRVSPWIVAALILTGWNSPAADCNGNGREDSQDLLPGNFGFFSPPTIRAAADLSFVLDLVTADLDRDGDPDFIIADLATPEPIILIAQEDGSIVEGTPVPWDGASLIFEAADLDGDGAIDLISSDADSVLFFRNRGDGTFEDRTASPAGDGPQVLAAADLDGDGRLDLAIGNQGSLDWPPGETVESGVRILWNRAGGFHDGGLVESGPHPRAMAAGDLDADGDMDLVVAADDMEYQRMPPFLLLGDGKGSFAPPEELPAPATRYYNDFALDDVDGNGSIEIIAAGDEVTVFARSGDGGFVAAASLLHEANRLSMADLDGDGRREIVTADDWHGIRIHRNLGGLSFESGPGLGPEAVTAATVDLDADGDIEIVGIDEDGTLFFLPNPGDGDFRMWRNHPTGEDPMGLVAADFDEDGDLDVAVAHDPDEEESVLLFLNDGSGGFGPPAGHEDPRIEAESVTAADLDGDGHVDLAGGGSSLWYRPGGGKDLLGEAVILYPRQLFGVPVAEDMDRDGDVDIVGLSYERGGSILNLMLFRNRGGGEFEEPAVIRRAEGASTSKVIAADLDGEGMLDIIMIVAEGSRRICAVIRGGPDGYSAGPTIDADQELEDVAAADFDLDGDVDLAFALHDVLTVDHEPGKVLIYLNDGTGNLAPGGEAALRTSSYSIAAADLDGDGDADLVASEIPDRFAVILNHGDGTFAEPLSTLAGSEPWVFAADIDGNGVADVLCLNESQGALVVHANPVIPPASRDGNRNGVPDECEGPPFHRGDPNADGIANISDAIFLFEYLFLGGGEPPCLEASDDDDDGRIEITDGIRILQWLFQGGPPPAFPGPPGRPCGLDGASPGSAGNLGCGSYDRC